MIENSSQRVSNHTSPRATAAIERRLERNLADFAIHPGEIERRLGELDAEWDVERTLETMASSLTLCGLVFSIVGRRRWLLLPLAVQSFFLQHALQGWCPPLPVLRRLGFRTRAEIDRERYALKVLRGDFDRLGSDHGSRTRQVLHATDPASRDL